MTKKNKTDMMTIHRKDEQSFQFSINQSMINTAILTFVIVFYASVQTPMKNLFSIFLVVSIIIKLQCSLV